MYEKLFSRTSLTQPLLSNEKLVVLEGYSHIMTVNLSKLWDNNTLSTINLLVSYIDQFS